MIGTRVAHFRITAKLGEGGMGEVYRAEDLTLRREVAIKALPPAFTTDAERLERFQAEARTVAALNHPGIAQVYGLEAVDGRHLLVMELVEGEDLSERLQAGRLAGDQVVSIARQISDALEAAHEKGIVHRDLKPANIKLRRDGAVKILDFGLAKMVEGGGLSAIDAGTTLGAGAMTALGAVVGTPGYMSPEQARGLAVDRRSDIWSFGVVVWEMLTGRRLFTGETVSDVLAAVLREEPDLDALPADTPPALRRIVRRCLRRDPRSRLQWIGDARLELEEARPDGDRPATEVGEGTRTRRRVAVGLAAAAGLAIGVLAGLTWIGGRSAETAQPAAPAAAQRLVSDLIAPEGYSFSAVDGGPAISRDGRLVAFLAFRPGEPVFLFVRSLDGAQVRRVDGVPGAKLPFFAPDGRSLSFFAQGKLKRLDLASWEVVDLADAPDPAGGSWSEDGRIAFVGDGRRPPRIVSADGGQAQQLPPAFPGLVEPYYTWCELLPDGRHFLFTLQDLAGPHSGIQVASLDAPEAPTTLTRTISRPVYVEPGWLLYSRGAELEARRFDPAKLVLGAEAIRIADGVAWGRYFVHGRFAVSRTGLLVFAPGEAVAGDTELVVTDRQGLVLSVPGELAEYYSPRLSHDGTRIAVDRTDVQTTQGDIWILDAERGTRTRLSSSPIDESDPLWLPGDGEVIYHSGADLFRRDRGAATAKQSLLTSDVAKQPRDVSPDGTQLLFEVTTEAGVDLWDLDLDSGRARPWLADPAFDESHARFSPDGRWVAYQTDESGAAEVVLRSFPDTRERIAVSAGGGRYPVWRADGHELFYLSPASEIIAVPIAWSEGRPHPGRPTALFRARLREGASDTEYDVFPDGRRFLLNRVVVAAPERSMRLVQHWDVALRDH